MTDAGGAPRHSTPRSGHRSRRAWSTRWALPPLIAVALMVATGVTLQTPGGAGADQLGDLKTQAAQLETQISTTETHIDADSQRYDAAQVQLHQVEGQITTTKAHIAADQATVTADRGKLRDAAINEFVTDDTALNEDPLFGGNEQTAAQEAEYRRVAEGDLGTALSVLHDAEGKLHTEEGQLETQQDQVQQASDAAAQARSTAQDEQGQLQAEENQDQGQIHEIITQREAAAQAAQAEQEKEAAARLAAQKPDPGTTGNGDSTTVGSTSGSTGGSTFVPPSNASAGAVAVAAAESQLGVPYVYADEDPGVGFDCSGLTAWAWGQAGVSLDHYSGAQMQESTPVPLSDLEPGDLLFYGPGGSQHVAMYVGGGTMIEAPHTGAVVWLTPLRTDGGFVGAGRP